MPSGGSRAGSGRTPDPMALRRDRKDDAAWLVLSSADRVEAAPAWPLATQTDREVELWLSLWRKPIAAIWARDQQVEQVAIYVRTFAEAEAVDAAPARRTLLRQLAGELLLTIPSMLLARVRIATDEVAEKRETKAEPKPRSSRDRMKVVNGGRGAV